MKEYMVTVYLPDIFTEEFLATIPAHQAHVNELLERNVLLQYSLSTDHRFMWMVVLASSEESVENILKLLPLSEHFHYHISELIVHSKAGFTPTPVRFLLN